MDLLVQVSVHVMLQFAISQAFLLDVFLAFQNFCLARLFGALLGLAIILNRWRSELWWVYLHSCALYAADDLRWIELLLPGTSLIYLVRRHHLNRWQTLTIDNLHFTYQLILVFSHFVILVYYLAVLINSPNVDFKVLHMPDRRGVVILTRHI